MELIITAVILLILLLILGVSPYTIIYGIFWLMEGALAAMTVFFVVSIIMLLAGRRYSARFLRFTDTKFPAAVYEIDGEELTNFYPAENLLQKWIYTEGSRPVRMLRLGKLCFLFDRHSMLIAALGLPLSLTGAAALGHLLFMTL